MITRERVAATGQGLRRWPGPSGRPALGQVLPGLGRAASAAAFATGVALEMPSLAAGVGALAFAVGASRAITGERHPSEVAAGFALGTAAGLLTLRWWPRRPDVPAAAARPRREAPASPDGAGLVMVVNCSAGSASQELADSLGKSLPAAEVVVVSADDDLDVVFRDAAGRAAILGVAGGDGSVRVAAGAAVATGLPLLVVPAGTFNHFAGDLGVQSADDALDALREGDSVVVDVASANGDAYLNTASTGVYVDLVRAREELEPVIGKWPAVLIALVDVLRHSRPVDLLVNGRRRRVWLMFAGNCRYEPSGAAPAYRPDLADGTRDVRLIDGSQPLARTRLIAAVLLGTLGRSRVYLAWSASVLDVASADGEPAPLCLDGEATRTTPGSGWSSARKSSWCTGRRRANEPAGARRPVRCQAYPESFPMEVLMVTRISRRRTIRTRRTARRAANGRLMAWLARAGLASRGLMYVLIGIIAVQIAVNGSHQQADRAGAVRLVAKTPLGSLILWLLVIGFAGMTLWRLSEAIWGSTEAGGRKPVKRLANLARAVFYAVVTYGILKYALGIGQPSSSDTQSQDLTAAALRHQDGQVIVALAGVVVAGAGLYTIYRAYKLKFLKLLRMGGTSPATRKAVRRLGQIGGIARGFVFGAAGVFLIIAAQDANPHQAKGVDSTLRALARTPLGPWLLVVVALGLMTFGVYSWCEARWREV